MLKNFIRKTIGNLNPRGSLFNLKSKIFDKLGPGDIGIDLGANIGEVTARMAAGGATIYAFEPNPYAYQVLKDRFYGISNVQCLNKGVLDYNGVLCLYLHENAEKDQIKWSTGSSFLSFKGNINKDNFVEVEVIDLVKFIESINRGIKLLKMDVEGVECQLINKLIDSSMIKRIDYLLVETHDKKIPELKDETDKLRRRIKEFGLTNICLDWI